VAVADMPLLWVGPYLARPGQPTLAALAPAEPARLPSSLQLPGRVPPYTPTSRARAAQR
jgi:hypothetical protein